MLASTEVDIRSIWLKDILLEIFDGVEGLSLNKTPPTVRKPLYISAQTLT